MMYVSFLLRLQVLVFVVLGVGAFQSLPVRDHPRHQCLCLQALDSEWKDLSERRGFIQAGVLALSTLMLGGPPIPLAKGASPRTIVLTGGNSGLGFEGAKKLALAGHTIVLPCRTMQKSLDAVERLEPTGGNFIAAECDLASLESVRKFAKGLPALIGDTKIDTLCLNAGMSRSSSATDVVRTVDGFELTGMQAI